MSCETKLTSGNEADRNLRATTYGGESQREAKDNSMAREIRVGDALNFSLADQP